MTANSIIAYLENYRKQAIPYLEIYFKRKITEAQTISNLSVDILQKLYDLSIRGKMIRGFLVCLGYEIADGKENNTITDLSTFIEIAQEGLLVHDDIMDEDELRRGLPTIHSVYLPKHYGESMAICAGDLAFYLSWDKLLSSNFPSDIILRTAKLYSHYFIRIAIGQILDISSSAKTQNQKNILLTYLLKTAEYSGAMPLLIGATLAGLTDEILFKNLETYGLSLGWIFQIRDDYLGLYGDPKTTGKPIGSDIREGKQTLMVAHFLKHAPEDEKKYFLNLFGKPINIKETHHIIDLFDKIGSKMYAEKLMQNYFDKGIKTVPQITGVKRLRTTLADLLTFMLVREK